MSPLSHTPTITPTSTPTPKPTHAPAHQRRLSRLARLGLASAIAVTGVQGWSAGFAPPAQAATVTIGVDFAATTGAFRGGATGTLYGLGSYDVPSQAIINGAHMTNASSKPPDGLQHPTGDVLQFEDGFFDKYGEYLAVYMQDFYAEWYYNNGTRPGDTRTYSQVDGSYTSGANGVWDYLEIVEFVTRQVATRSNHADKYLMIPFNEAEANWYSRWNQTATSTRGNKTTWCNDYQAIYAKIQDVWQETYPGEEVPIGGGGHTGWKSTQTTDELTCALAATYNGHNLLPQVRIWHELGTSPQAFATNLAAYRAIEANLGVPTTQVNISEWGLLTDMGVPGRLLQWFAGFEEAKADAQTAYWNYAGNLDDNVAQANGASGGWWMFKWYGDLAGSETVQVTVPTPNTFNTHHAIGAIDETQKRATVLFGGGNDDVSLNLTGLDPDVFGQSVDIEVREIQMTGAEGYQGNPRLVYAADGVALAADGSVAPFTVPVYYGDAAYKVVVTPAQARSVSDGLAAQVWSNTTEAEDAVLTLPATRRDFATYGTCAGGQGCWQMSKGWDVAWFNTAAARADWSVNIPRDGTYRLQIIRSTDGNPGRHALFIDGTFNTLLQYKANLGGTGQGSLSRAQWWYRGSDETELTLTAGTHTFSVRASQDGSTALPYADIALDKFVLTEVTTGEPTEYPATDARLIGGATFDFDADAVGGAGAAQIAGAGQRADFYLTAWEPGYHTVSFLYGAAGATSATVTVNGAAAATLTASTAGQWRSTATLFLSEGINEVEVASTTGIGLVDLTVTRDKAADAAAYVVEAEATTLNGTASVSSLASSTGTNVSGGQYVGWVGAGAANYITVGRDPKIAQPGNYALVVRYSNAETSGNHDYNPQVVDRFLDVSESTTGGYVAVGKGGFRYSHNWNSFWNHTIQVTLTTSDGALKLHNDTAYGPNIDKLTIAPVLTGAVVDTPLAAPVDKSALAALVAAVENTAQATLKGEYTDASYDAFQDALDDADDVLASSTVTQADVDAAVAALQAAVDALWEVQEITTWDNFDGFGPVFDLVFTSGLWAEGDLVSVVVWPGDVA
ncbi:MAG: FIVAR domain-containing protein, partial [Bifidobacteriaceae bacterium]|nr:FIVAR domain-containing protein [Bifidobacteriaceae bacterium]